MPKPHSAFDITASALKGRWESYTDVAQWLADEIENSLSARAGVEAGIKYWWKLYEQQRTRGGSLPWPDAADLTSPFASEYVDAIHARLMTTVFAEPVWTVEGFGASAAKAPFVEEFHQRAAEEERLQGYVDEACLRALVEGVGIIEVSEGYELRRERKTIRAKLQLDPDTGQPIMGEQGPLLEQDGDGQFVQPQTPLEPSAETEIDSEEPVRLGPSYDIVPYLDSVVLPHHARNKHQVWGEAKRFWKRVPELVADATKGIYDRQAVEDIGTENERHTMPDEAPAVTTVPTQEGPTAQKELWTVQVLMDFDGKGARWWRLTIHKDKCLLLRMKHDDRTTRTVRFVPFPKPGLYERGYSLVGDKMITAIEEDTAVRNIRADRAAMKASQPVLRLNNALWDPYEQRIGPGAVIDVRQKDEITMLQGIDDVPQSIIHWKADVRNDAERLAGQNDVSVGQQTEEKRTLGEVQLVAGYAEVRMNVILRRLQEAMEELFQARHLIWQRALRMRAQLPQLRALVVGRSAPGHDIQGLAQDGSVTAELLDGVFWGKPNRSVETADLSRQRADFNQFLAVLPPLLQMNPMLAMIFQTIPAAKALIKTALRVNRVQDVHSFLGPEANGVFEQMAAQQQQQAMLRDPRMQMLMQMAGMAGGGPSDVTQGQPALPAGETPPPAPGGPPTGVM